MFLWRMVFPDHSVNIRETFGQYSAQKSVFVPLIKNDFKYRPLRIIFGILNGVGGPKISKKTELFSGTTPEKVVLAKTRRFFEFCQ